MMKKISKWCFFLLYFFLAKHLPVSNYPLGKVGRWLRLQCCKRLFRKCGPGVNVERGADFLFGDTIEIGARSGIGVDAWIRAELSIGRDVMMGPGVMIYGRYHNYQDTCIPMMDQGMAEYRPIIVDDDVWIGARAILLQGISIGKGSIIGAGAVVTRDVPPYSVVVGNPARVIRVRTRNHA